jgi:hypothetical protein
MTKAEQRVLCAAREPIDPIARSTHRGSGFLAWTPKNRTMALAFPQSEEKLFLSMNYLTLLNRFLNDAAWRRTLIWRMLVGTNG